MAGRKLANKPMFLQTQNGLLRTQGRSSVSYFQSPTEAKQHGVRMAFRGVLRQRMAVGIVSAPPHLASSVSKGQVQCFQHLDHLRTISGPMPSPGNTAIFIDHGGSQFLFKQCGCSARACGAGVRPHKALILSA